MFKSALNYVTAIGTGYIFVQETVYNFQSIIFTIINCFFSSVFSLKQCGVKKAELGGVVISFSQKPSFMPFDV